MVFLPGLREDYNRIAGLTDRRAQIREREGLGRRRYRLGFFKDEEGEECYGVERHYTEESKVNVKQGTS